MSFPLYKRLKAFHRRRNAITNSLDLTRSLTIHLTACLTARVALSFTPSPYFAELREDVLLLYPIAQLVHFASGMFTYQSAQCQSHTTLSSIAQKVPAKHVISFAIEATRFSQRARKLVLVKTKGKPSVRLIFDSSEERDTWMQAISASLNREKKHLSHFKIIKHVGKGASGRVYKVLDTTTNETLALKVIDKAYVFETESSYRHAMDERIVLQIVRDHPFVLDMRYAFQNAKRLFLVTEYCGGGDMFEFLNQRPTPLPEEAARFVTCEIILAIEHIHNLGIVYRDLKLENILIDADGHVRLADFGLTKVLRQDNGKLCRTNTFCGTKEYVAPEMIRGDSYDMSLDFWALGILLYEMMSGKTPFYHDDHDQIYDRIEKAPIFFPTDFSSEVRSLITSLLKRRPKQRLGTGSMGIEEIKLHEWFKDVDWDSVKVKAVESPLRKGLRFRRESLDDSQLSARAKKRRQEQRKAMAAVEQDVKADKKYVSSLGSGVHVGNRPKAPMEKRRGGILAGYCFRSLKPGKAPSEEILAQSGLGSMMEVYEESSSEAKVEATGSGFMSDSTSAVALMTETTNADGGKDVSATSASSHGSEAASSPAIGESDPNEIMVIPSKNNQSEDSLTVKGKSASMPPTPAITSADSPAIETKGGPSCSSAPATPRSKPFQLPPSHHFPHLQALLKSSSSENAKIEDSTHATGVPMDTVVNARIDNTSTGSESTHVEEVVHVVDEQNKTAIATDPPKVVQDCKREIDPVVHVLEKEKRYDYNKDAAEVEQDSKFETVDDPRSEQEGSTSFAIASGDFIEDSTRTNNSTDDHSVGNGEDGITSVGVHEIREALGFPTSKTAKQDLDESRAVEDDSVADRSVQVVTEMVNSVSEAGDKLVDDTSHETSHETISGELHCKAEAIIIESPSSPSPDVTIADSSRAADTIQQKPEVELRGINDSQLCDVSSLVTEMCIANPFVPSPTSVQDVAGAGNVPG
eukprot:TRINITY_DN3515_c0_g1_i1.p1 TRINITY_DN3515_c0_g1~~TRINITY_DN3515_c0_g1_i1.p1  ORF type:complete len:978 (+),score=175.54 TRINITY_DN3515_c0_g1_i1:3161-6094(+)